MRRFFVALLCAALTVTCLPVKGGAETAELIRLHVVADGNDAVSQAQKLIVRDAVRAAAAKITIEAADADDAFFRLCREKTQLERAARKAAAQAECHLPVKVYAGEFSFPVKRYGAAVVEAGAYRAIRVVIGSGAGRNWWCVLYPSLCTIEPVEPEGQIVFYSSIVRYLQSLFQEDHAA